MTEHLGAGNRELAPTCCDERNGHYARKPLTPVDKINAWICLATVRTSSQPRPSSATSARRAASRRQSLRCTSRGVSSGKTAGITGALSKVRIGKDAASRIATRLEEGQKAWRGCPLKMNHPYPDATYPRADPGATDLALLAAGVDR
jgi:transposase-like protein